MQDSILDKQIAHLWEQNSKILLGYLIKKTNHVEDSKDIMAQTFAKYFVSQSKSDSAIDNPKAFLWKIADNQLIDYYRHKATNKSRILNWTTNLDIVKVKEASASKNEALDEIIICIKKIMSSEDFEVANQIYVDKMTYKEVLSGESTNPQTLRQRLSRSFKKAKSACQAKFKELLAK
jgi:RNA polymerase sigma factor (sigma-70 family)